MRDTPNSRTLRPQSWFTTTSRDSRKGEYGTSTLAPGRLELFRNTDENGNPYPRPRTLLIDSAQLESGEGLGDNFRAIAGPELERFRREVVELAPAG